MTSVLRISGTLVAAIMLLGGSLHADVDERRLNNGQLILQDVPEIPQKLAARLAQYQNVRSAIFLDWTEDGQGIYIKTRFASTQQIHRVRSPGGTRSQLTYFREPVGEMARQEGGRLVAFTMDQGGSEFSQIFLLDPQRGESRLLTDGRSRNRILLWNDQGTAIAYQTTRRNGKDNDVWMLDPADPAGARPVHESDDGAWWGPGAFSADGRFMLLQQYISVEDSRIYLKDLLTGEMRLLAGAADTPSANRIAAMDNHGGGFYFITNARRNAAELAWQSLEPETPLRFITAGIPWDVTEFALSDDGRRGAFVTNEEGISRLYLLDTQSLRYRPVKDLPVGLIFGLKFHPDNRRLAMTMNTPQTPSDVFVMRLGRRATRD
ncbi:MAG: hypothetical protein R3212_08530, partial [Xanthomonadales bacterium]|nr:hypothetical protein [Xanthomonadales bacterium]